MSMQNLIEEEYRTPRLGLNVDIPIPSAKVVSWKERDWYWLNRFRLASLENPELYRPIYKNYLRWYISND